MSSPSSFGTEKCDTMARACYPFDPACQWVYGFLFRLVSPRRVCGVRRVGSTRSPSCYCGTRGCLWKAGAGTSILSLTLCRLVLSLCWPVLSVCWFCLVFFSRRMIPLLGPHVSGHTSQWLLGAASWLSYHFLAASLAAVSHATRDGQCRSYFPCSWARVHVCRFVCWVLLLRFPVWCRCSYLVSFLCPFLPAVVSSFKVPASHVTLHGTHTADSSPLSSLRCQGLLLVCVLLCSPAGMAFASPAK